MGFIHDKTTQKKSSGGSRSVSISAKYRQNTSMITDSSVLESDEGGTSLLNISNFSMDQSSAGRDGYSESKSQAVLHDSQVSELDTSSSTVKGKGLYLENCISVLTIRYISNSVF